MQTGRTLVHRRKDLIAVNGGQQLERVRREVL
jgi:hypothetical protein